MPRRGCPVKMTMLVRDARISGGTGSLVDLWLDDGVISRIVDAGTPPPTDTRAAQVELDAAGKWVSPGLWDNHVHASQWALSARRLDVSTAESAGEAGELVADALAAGAAVTAGHPFIGAGFRDGLWPDTPTLEILDAAGDGVPVVLISGDLHAAWLNSAALELYGHRGHETGLLREVEAFEVTRRINSVPEPVVDLWLAEAANAAAARGVVGIVDLEMDWNLHSWQRRMAAGFDSLRVEFGIYSQHLDRAAALGLRSGLAITPLLAVGRFKVITDGSLNTRTAYCYDEYPGLEARRDSRGVLTVAPAELQHSMRAASDAGLESSVHAIGDHATSLALDAFERLGIGGRIEHAQLVSSGDVPRFAALGVTASVQPDHAMDDRDVAEKFWPGRTGRAFPLRALLDSGAELAFGSDAPVSALDPWATMAAAVGRSRGDREPWHPEQRISVREALAASTRSRVAPGEPADLIVTDDDPSELTAQQLRDVAVQATLLGGRVTHNLCATQGTP
jgi:predicted amidohydrolase YtcJ